MDELIKSFCDILHKHGFDFSEDDIKRFVDTGESGYIDLVVPGCEPMFGTPTRSYFGSDIVPLRNIAYKLKIRLPYNVWFD